MLLPDIAKDMHADFRDVTLVDLAVLEPEPVDRLSHAELLDELGQRGAVPHRQLGRSVAAMA